MRGLCLAVGLSAALSAASVAYAAPDPETWRQVNLEDTIYMDTTQGRIVIEMFPDVAPAHVTQIKKLVRQKFYDGITFHRVVDNMMAQGGDPKGTGEGGSSLPNVPAEFRFRRSADMGFTLANSPGGALTGFYKSLPIVTQPNDAMAITRDGKADAWALHCPGIASMARTDEENSANSQFFLMRQPYPSLDKRYTIWGRVVWGTDIVRKLAVGAPPPNPDKMTQVRIAADVPASERAPLYVMRTDSKEFAKILEDTKKKRGADFSVCDIEIPATVSAANDNGKEPWWRRIPLIP